MNLSNAKAEMRLSAAATPVSTGTSGSLMLGLPTTTVRYQDADVLYSAHLAAGYGAAASVAVLSGAVTLGAGTAQVETATAFGDADADGTVDVTISGLGYGVAANKTIEVPVLDGDTNIVWAGKVREALAADADVAAVFLVGGAAQDIVLTARHRNANQASLNIALENGTPSPGIIDGTTSASTTAGVAGGTVTDGDGKDFEGVTIPTMGKVCAMVVACAAGRAVLATGAGSSVPIAAGGVVLLSGADPQYLTLDFLSGFTITANEPGTDITMHVLGISA